MYNINPETKTLESILNALPELLKSGFTNVQNKYQIGCIILNIINLNSSVLNHSNFEIIMENLLSWMSIIDEFFYLEHPIKDDLFFLYEFLCHSVLKY